jgi:hypothetical protein
MAGGLMQLVAYGAQDVYLTANPQITFWKVTYRRYTNFAIESIEQTFNGQADFGRRVQCTISRNGDLAYRTYLEVTLPKIEPTKSIASNNIHRTRWLDYPGEQLIQDVEVEIGGQRIDIQYGQWMHIWNQLTMTKEQEAGYLKMIGHTTALTYMTHPAYFGDSGACEDNNLNVCAPRNYLPETTLYVPLQFWFCRNPGLALPLIALQYHEVKINFNFTPMEKMCIELSGTAPNQNISTPSGKLVNASLFVDYIFLDTDERRRMAQNPHEYLIEQLQFTGEESVGSSSNKIRLNFNHPCKELIWTVQKDKFVDNCVDPDDNTVIKLGGCQYFNYTDSWDVLPRTLAQYSLVPSVNLRFGQPVQMPDLSGVGDLLVGGSGENAGLFPAEQLDNGPGVLDLNIANNIDIEAGLDNRLMPETVAYVAYEKSRGMHCWGENPVVTAKLQLNGQDRFSEREGSYFDVVQPFQHHTRHPDTGINVYSFALRPEEHQPSGTCNFSRIDNATLHLLLSHKTVNNSDTAKVRVYAVNYNVLRIMSGMGGLAYSN